MRMGPWHRPRPLRHLAALVLPLALGCSSLRTIDIGVCGNQVVEPEAGETCDTFAPEGGTECRAPGEQHQCRLVCAPGGPVCPSDSSCGTDGICRSPSGRFAPTHVSLDMNATAVARADFDADGRDDLVFTTATSFEILYFDAEFATAHRESSRRELLGLAGPRPLDAQSPAPAVGDLSGTSTDDVLLPFRSGALIALGSPDRELRFKAHPAVLLSDTVEEVAAIAAEIDPAAPGTDVIVLGTLSCRW